MSHVVTCVKTEDNQKLATVSCQNGNCISSRAVIVTLPLGVLKSKSVSFIPSLPSNVQESIERLGVGSFEKLFLVFEQKFWPDEDVFYVFPGKDESQIDTWINISALSNTKEPILAASFTGSRGCSLRSLTAEEIVSLGLASLRGMFGEKRIPKDKNAALALVKSYSITSWEADPFAKGCYSHIACNASPLHFDTLANASLCDRVFFAGEATSRRYPGTVHGALLSGRRVAEKLLKMIG
mmetsp:Transcript_21313/g.27224  ORF Transcript_21313/g.27224 Transcript_21313/m.27224 type:complete len:239 (+) Transcript_21313:3-719(+)